MSLYADNPRGRARRYRLSEHGPDHSLAPNFTLIELACPWDRQSDAFGHQGTTYCDEVLVHDRKILGLQGARDYFGAPLIIHRGGGYRTPAYNATIEGAAENSYHTEGMAADCHVEGVPADELASFFRDVLEAGGVALYTGHVHMSVGREGEWGLRFANAFPNGAVGYGPRSVPPSMATAPEPMVAGLGIVAGLLAGGLLWRHYTQS